MSSPSLTAFVDRLQLLEQDLLGTFPALTLYRWRDDTMRWPALWHELRTSPARFETCRARDLIRLATFVAVDASAGALAAMELLEQAVDAMRELYDIALNPDVSDPLGAHSAKRLKLERASSQHVPDGVIGVVLVHEIELVRQTTP